MTAAQSRIQEAIGARAAVKLSRRAGGAPVYVRCAKPNYATITSAERRRIGQLYAQGYYAHEIAAITGRSISSIGPIIFCEVNAGRAPRLPKASSFEGRAVRAALREGHGLSEARQAAKALFREQFATKIAAWEAQSKAKPVGESL